MEKISDFFKDIKDRLSSPLLSSFIIAWLITNWRIPIGLLFYKIDDLKLDGYNSYDDLINRNINLNNSLSWPLSIALFYTFIFPIIKNVILAFSAWVKRWGTDWTLNIAKTGSISVARYIQLKEQYTKLISEFVMITKSEGKVLEDNSALTAQLTSLSNERNLLESEFNRLKGCSSLDMIQGQWRYKVFKEEQSIDEFILGNRMDIANQTVEIYRENILKETYSVLFVVGNFSHLILILNKRGKLSPLTSWIFNIHDSNRILNGRDNQGYTIQMERLT
jgi:hypothetical protein